MKTNPPINKSRRRFILSTAIGALLLAASPQIASAANNLATGPSAGVSFTTGVYNTAYGINALRFDTTGSYNTAVGPNALVLNVGGTQNTGIGVNALQANVGGSYNVGLGVSALFANTSGNYNTGVGNSALYANTTGAQNTAIGLNAMLGNKGGSFNSALGLNALAANVNGNNNTAVGYHALLAATGTNNIGLGLNAGQSLTTGSNNIDIGNAGVAAESGIIRIGTGGTHLTTYIAGVITGNGSGLTNLTGSSFGATANFPGTVGIGALSAGVKLTVTGTQDISPTSDGIFNVGDTAGLHVTLDDNEIHARNGAGSSNLYINDSGGAVAIAGSAIVANHAGDVGFAANVNLNNGRLSVSESVGTQAGPTTGSLVIQHQDTGGASSIVFPSKNNNGSDYGYIQYQDDSTIGGAGEKSLLTIGVQNDGIGSGNDDNIALMTSGGVGINTTTPGKLLDVNGSANFTGTISSGTGNSANGMIEVNYGTNGDRYGITQDTGGAMEVYTSGVFSGSSIQFGQMNSNTNAFVPQMMITHGGAVGIGTTTPTQAKFVVNGLLTNAQTAGTYFENGNTALQQLPAGHSSYSIFASARIAAQSFDAISDARIKQIEGRSNATQDLATMMKIEVTNYTFKDKVALGNVPQKKVIAQQVEQVYPQAVSKHTDVVPDIYEKATVKDGWVQLASDLKVGDRVRLVGEKNEEGIQEVLEVRDGAFRTAFQPATGKVFVYGREVKDFRAVDYEAISMLNVSATQQIKKEKDAEVKALQDENAALKRQLATTRDTLEKRLAALEARDPRVARGGNAHGKRQVRTVAASLSLR